jgi:hypothetical protein
MSTNANHPLDDRRFDRLVDDELNERERRDLLRRLDDEPNGWRQCALAFLEAQCWKQALGSQPTVETAAPTRQLAKSTPRPATVRRSAWGSMLGTAMAMAASFLLAFWVFSIVERGRLPIAGNGDQFANVNPQTVRAPSQGVGSTQAPWRMVTVKNRDGGPGGITAVRVPAVERNDLDQAWLDSIPSVMPDDVRKAFGRAGHEIEQHRELIPVPMEDGRRLVMPVDQVDVHYIGNRSY